MAEETPINEESLDDLWGAALKEQDTTEVKNWGPDHIEKKKSPSEEQESTLSAASDPISKEAQEPLASEVKVNANASQAKASRVEAAPIPNNVTELRASSGGGAGAGASGAAGAAGSAGSAGAAGGNSNGGGDGSFRNVLSNKLKLLNIPLTPVNKLVDEIKTGDESINKLNIQNIDFILNVPLKVSVELGRCTILIKDLLQLGQGSVIELDKVAGEALEILVNGQLVARGEVVVINEKFGVRLTDIVNPVQRIESLRAIQN